MKNLKKVLSLALVIAMMLSLVVVASAATINDYSDKADITYVEAVDVLTKIGVLAGTNGAFNPTMNISRQEAAKIMAYVVLGAAADKLANTPASSFSDVPVTSWANPYIEYCATAGIIKGVGNGQFAPLANVTGSQMATMLLRALGYGVKGEYEGTSWENNAIRDGMRYNILTSDVDYSAPATREEVALYALNALATTQVTWSDLFGGYIDTTGTIVNVKDLNALGVDVFGLKANDDIDAFGFGGRFWTLNNRIISDVYPQDTVVAEFNTSASTNKGYFFNQGAWETTVEVYINGSNFDMTYIDGVSTEVASSAFADRGSNAAIDATIAGPGMRATLIDGDNNGRIDKIIFTYEVLAQVETVNTSAGTVTVKYYAGGATTTVDYGAPLNIAAEGLVAKDMVLITPANNKTTDATLINTAAQPLKVVKATSVTTKVAAYTGTVNTNPSTVKLGDTTYSFSYVNVKDGAIDFKSDFVFFIDSYKNVIRYVAPTALGAAALDYLYVYDSIHTAGNAFTDGSAKIAVTYTDGKSENVSVPVVKNATSGAWEIVKGGANIPLANVATGWYSYTKNADGEVVLTDLITASTENEIDVVTSAKSPLISVDSTTQYATTKTELVTALGGTATKTVNYNNFTANNFVASTKVHTLVIYDADGNVARIYVIGGTPEADAKYGIITKLGEASSSGREYSVMVAGATAAESFVRKETPDFAVGDIVNTSESTWTAKTPTATTGIYDVVFIADGYFVAEGASAAATDDVVYNYDENCLFYNATTDKVTSAPTPSTIDTIDGFIATSLNKVMVVIYTPVV